MRWCKDKWGVCWHITPREAVAAGGDEARRAYDAMMHMKKIDVAKIEAAGLRYSTEHVDPTNGARRHRG